MPHTEPTLNFEQRVRALLDKHFACCALSNIPIFRPDAPEHRERGYEIDHLIHVRSDIGDRLVVIECKDIPIIGDHPGQRPTATGKWQVLRHDATEPKDVKRTQLLNHARALQSYLHDYRRPLVFEAWCVSSYDDTPSLRDVWNPTIHFRLYGQTDFARELARLHAEGSVLRVEQSALLGEVRKGVPVRDMGHPELNNAIAYVARCRKSIDVELFRLFERRKQRWAINGAAGMGKSVLLAYALFVFSSNRRVAIAPDARDSTRSLLDFSETAQEIGLPPHGERVIYAAAKKDKQLQVLEHYWELFAAEYSQLEDGGSLRFQRPVFRKWSLPIPEDCNVLLIDESHDLDADDQTAVATWLKSEGTRYLAIACDRHQKLRLVGSNAVLIEGLSFSGQTTKLRRNYRNPFPVYAAGLALMFRWFAANGPKVIPTAAQLKDEFGFDEAAVTDAPGSSVTLRKWNDSHPGNYWNFTTSVFFSCQDAFAQLGNAGLSRRDVLWVRFREEEEGFDYEQLLRFTYHNVFSDESFELVDKYVKGQEFPIVVVEGFPALANRSEFSAAMDDAEKDMWKARRQLYLCCSRSTAFLYFVLPSPEGGQFKGLASEILELVKQVSTPEDPTTTTKRIWRVQFYRTSLSRTVDDFVWESLAAIPPQPAAEAEVTSPVTVRKLSAAVNVDAGTLFTSLFAHDFTVKFSTDIIPDEIAREIALEHGVILRVKPGSEPPPPPEAQPAAAPTPTQPTLPLVPAATLPVQVVSTPPPSRESTSVPAPGGLDTDLDSFLHAPNFPRFGRAVDQYLSILTWLAGKHPRGREALLNYRRGSRRYFATSAEEIARFARSPNTKRIGVTGLYAMTTTDTATKRAIIGELLRTCGIGLAVREKAVSSILS